MLKSERQVETPFSERTKQVVWFTAGALCGLAMLSICKAALPPSNSLSPSTVTDDTAIYQNMSEIQVPKERQPNFDGDINNLSKLELRDREKIATAQPRPRAVLSRVAQPRIVAKRAATPAAQPKKPSYQN